MAILLTNIYWTTVGSDVTCCKGPAYHGTETREEADSSRIMASSHLVREQNLLPQKHLNYFIWCERSTTETGIVSLVYVLRS